ncbi:MAG: NAD(P)H-hydrate epimerase, partial [Candidatus Bathyarchaeia archaeon]
MAREVASRFTPSRDRVAVLSGIGGNGGDGFVAARHLASLGFKVTVVLVGTPQAISNEGAKANWEALTRMGESVRLFTVPDSELMPELTADVFVDALLGTGVRGSLRPPLLQAVRRLNQAEGFKVAVDIPSGIDADTGEVLGEAVKADVTVALHRVKTGLEKAGPYVGKLKAASIGIPPEAEHFAGPGDVLLAVKPRPAGAHKGDFGRLLIVAGSGTYT